MNYKKHIGDGRLPNRYWVFHYDEKFIRKADELQPTNAIVETQNNLLGEFKTYKESLNCINTQAYFPHVVIEDRLTGQVFESLCIVCPYCKKEDYETFEDIKYSKEVIEKNGLIFE